MDWLFFPSNWTIRSLGFSDCNLLLRIWQLVLSICNCWHRRNKLLLENELSNLRERLTNPWEQIAQFDITIYLCYFFFFENWHVLSGLSKCFLRTKEIIKAHFTQYMAEILPIRRKALSNQSINQSITNVYTIYDINIDIHVTICVV